ncbi:hypothetical protein PVAND_010773 [Polypedilum vanderplanki]|uniref:Ionotropic receptor n=1 Tax=Polypedilum vanderplanki TaxID=319348 RepID=A0A9J6CIC6_POLVA|nr:hypothetical protein PVAND_010773 [Polypedilum vanderplanki]
MWIRKIFNIYAILCNDTEDKLDFYTIEPFQNLQNCGDTSPKLLNKLFNDSLIKNLEIKKKFYNLNQCPIKVSTFNQNVAVIREIQSNGNVIYKGHEINMIKTLSNALNFTLEINFYHGVTDPFGTVYINGTATGALGDVQAEKTDIALGDYFLKASRWNFLDTSNSYLNYPVFCMIPKSDKLTAMEKMLQPFSKTVWIFLMVTLLIGLLSVFLINVKIQKLKPIVYGNKVNDPLMNMLIVVFGLQQKKLPKTHFARFILINFIILCLVLRSVYQGSLYKFLQSDGRHKDIQTIQELIDNKFTFLTYETNLDLIKGTPKLLETIHVLKSTKKQNIDELMAISKRVTMFVSEVNFIDYSRTHRTFPYTIINENFLTMNVVMYYRKDFYLKEAIDSKIQHILSGGLMNFWLREFDFTDYWKIETLDPMMLTMDHLEGAFYLLIFGNLIAFFVFITEIFLHLWERIYYII